MSEQITIKEAPPVAPGMSLWETALAGSGPGARPPGTKAAPPAVELRVLPNRPGGATPPNRPGSTATRRRRSPGRSAILVALVAVLGAGVALFNSSGSPSNAASGNHATTVTTLSPGSTGLAPGGTGPAPGTVNHQVPSCIAQPSNPTPMPGSTETINITQAPPDAQVIVQVVYADGITMDAKGQLATNAYGQGSVQFQVRTVQAGSSIGISAGVGGTSCVSVLTAG